MNAATLLLVTAVLYLVIRGKIDKYWSFATVPMSSTPEPDMLDDE